MKIKISYAGDSAMLIELTNEISPTINFMVNELRKRLEEINHQSIYEIIPTYRSIVVQYNPLELEFDRLKEMVEKRCKNLDIELQDGEKEILEIPVLYGGEWGPDIENIASYNKLTVEEVIKIHSEREYLVYMLGFTPGFPYLGGMSREIITPRLEKPRIKIPEGSVGIAGEQTGVYPVESPGGWQLLGKTPVKLFDKERKNPFLLDAGKYIKFVPIEGDEYRKIEDEVRKGIYTLKRYTKRSCKDAF